MKVASGGESALLGWDPQVAGASIEDNLKVLDGSSNTDLTIVLGIEIVIDFDFGVGVDVGEFLVWEEGLEGFHGLFNKWSMGHVGEEHFGFVGVTDFMGHFDLLDGEGEGQ